MRLWIVFIFIYGGGIAVQFWPNVPPLLTQAEYLEGMSDVSLRLLWRGVSDRNTDRGPPNRQGLKDLARLAELEKKANPGAPSNAWKEDPIRLEMPDGFEITAPADATHQELRLLGNDYLAIQEKKLRALQWTAVREGLAVWAITCFMMLLGGLAVRWVYRGFKARTS